MAHYGAGGATAGGAAAGGAAGLCPLGCNGPRFARAGLPPCTRNKDGQGR